MEFNSPFFLDFLALPIQNTKISTVQINEEKKNGGSLHQRKGETTDKKQNRKKDTYLLKSHLETQVTFYNQPSNAVRCTACYFQGQL